MSRKLRIFIIVVTLVLAAAVASTILPLGAGASRREAPPEGAIYAMRGAYAVGRRHLETGGDAPREMEMWYPALKNRKEEATTAYAYEVKIGAPLGTVTIATFAGQALDKAAPDFGAAPYPLVILSSGFATGSNAYAWLAEHLASHGFVVVAPEHAEHMDPENELWRAAIVRPHDILATLEYVDEQVGPGRTLDGLVDPGMVAVVGHSYGGYTALAAAGARMDTRALRAHCEAAVAANEPAAWLCNVLVPHVADMAELAGLGAVPEGLWPAGADGRVDAVISLAGDAFFFGEEGLAQMEAPVLAIGGTADEDSPYLWGTHPTYEYASSSRKVRIALEEAEHMIFSGPCEVRRWYISFLAGEFCADSTWDRYRAHDLVRHFATVFLLAELKQDAKAAQALGAEAVAGSALALPDVSYEAQGY